MSTHHEVKDEHPCRRENHLRTKSLARMIDALEFREVDNNLYALESYVLIFRLKDDDRGAS